MKKVSIILFLVVQTQFVLGQTKIIMQRDGGVFTVPCEVNGLKLKFIFDTGASAVTISLTEALFMLKNGYLKEKDIQGSSYAQLANGEITKNTKIILSEIKFSGFVIKNVEAFVIHELAAPLLLGQSAMKQIGTFQFDPNKGILTIINGKKGRTAAQKVVLVLKILKIGQF
ncbi:MAG: retroviral-like aspartic protease family protein [Bacteroidetes bacterium]|nr:retroviral-like aspartic protease family protein [Bacteroidota bacterium]